MNFSKYDFVYMKMAIEFAKLSSANRKKVAAIIVKDRNIIAEGYNGTPSGTDNNCEDENGKTKWEVLHAETNALAKLLKTTQSSEGATLYTTLSPCKDCSKLIYQSGISRIVYLEEYKDLTGVNFLKNLGLDVQQITI